MVYVGSTVSDILSRLERRYDKKITLHDRTKTIAGTRLNLIYHNTDSLETILSAVSEFTNLKIRRNGDEIVLRQP